MAGHSCLASDLSKRESKMAITIPNGLAQILDIYGDPRSADGALDKTWYRANIKIFQFPHTMVQSWGKRPMVKRFEAHRLVGQLIVDALADLYDLLGDEVIAQNGWNEWGGCFNFRIMRRGALLSTHSWGIACDVNPTANPLRSTVDHQPKELVDAFLKRGFERIADDLMHFQLCTGY